MSKKRKSAKPSPETRQAASKIARGIQRPGQSKEQTKLIAQGIEKGIDIYKRQQKAKARTLNKKLSKVRDRARQDAETDLPATVIYRQHWLPWLLLAFSWLGMALYLALAK